MTETLSTVRLELLLDVEDLRAMLATDVREGLTSTPKELPPKWFYDERGCELFAAITQLPEYYPTRREREILYSEAAAAARLTATDTLVELGSGSSEKTVLLLDAIAGAGRLRRFVPFDVAEGPVREIARMAADRYPGVAVHGVVGDFERHVGTLPREGRRLVAFLGGTIGNLLPEARRRFLASVTASLGPDDAFLLGADLVKDAGRLETAYDDAAGVTAEFNLNVLSVLNRELGADFDLGAFRHVARFDRENEWIEMLLRSTRDQEVTVPDLDLRVPFRAGEEMRTEISAKFRRQGLERELGAAGLELLRFWTDARGDFALLLARPAA